MSLVLGFACAVAEQIGSRRRDRNANGFGDKISRWFSACPPLTFHSLFVHVSRPGGATCSSASCRHAMERLHRYPCSLRRWCWAERVRHCLAADVVRGRKLEVGCCREAEIPNVAESGGLLLLIGVGSHQLHRDDRLAQTSTMWTPHLLEGAQRERRLVWARRIQPNECDCCHVCRRYRQVNNNQFIQRRRCVPAWQTGTLRVLPSLMLANNNQGAVV